MDNKKELKQWISKLSVADLKDLMYVLTEYLLDIEELRMDSKGPYWPSTGEYLCDMTDNEIKDDLVSFETAKLASEKYFGVWCSSAYFNQECLGMASDIPEGTFIKDTYLAPTQNILRKWLKKNYNIHIEVIWVDTLSDIYVYHISTTGNGIKPDSQFYNSYEEALEFGLIEALKLID